MTVTRDVVKDLLPVYLADEASADTRRVVDEYLAGDAPLAAQVAAARRTPFALPATPAPAQTAEKRALEATRRRLRHRTWTLMLAVLFTLAPFSIQFDGSGVTFIMWRDQPSTALAWWGAAALMWIAHFWIRGRTRVSGL